MFYSEMKEAEDYCESINKTYSFSMMHLCDGEVLYKFKRFNNYFWGFDMDLTNISLNQTLLLE